MAAYHHVWKKKNFYSEINERNSKVYIYTLLTLIRKSKRFRRKREKKKVYTRGGSWKCN